MRRLTVVLVALVFAVGCAPSAARAPAGGGETVELAAEAATWCGENMRAVYKRATELSANPGIDELNREVLAAGLEGREITAEKGNRLRDEWQQLDATGFARSCQRAFDSR
jgi:hypothetical protein